MEKIKFKFCFLFVFITLNINLFAQKSEIIRPGLLRAQATISPSYLFSDKNSYFYLHGNLEGYVNKNTSVCGEIYYYLGNQTSSNSKIDFNHSVFFGGSYHFTKNKNDLYIGLQPGIAITKLNAVENNLSQTTTGINPLVSSVVGYNFFVNNIFHFFVQSRLIIGEHNYDLHKDLSEFRFSAGLGFNINALKAK